MRRYVRLTKEYKDLEKLVAVTRRYRQLLAGIADAREVLESGCDDELRALAREEIDEASAEIPRIEEEIKLLLIPADPEDGKNAIVEIRGGTAATRPPYLQAICSRCTAATASRKAGAWL